MIESWFLKYQDVEITTAAIETMEATELGCATACVHQAGCNAVTILVDDRCRLHDLQDHDQLGDLIGASVIVLNQ